MHPANYILASFKDLSDVLCIDGSGEVGIAEAAIMCLRAQFLSRERTREKQRGQHYWTAPNHNRTAPITITIICCHTEPVYNLHATA